MNRRTQIFCIQLYSPAHVHISKHQCYRTMWDYITEPKLVHGMLDVHMLAVNPTRNLTTIGPLSISAPPSLQNNVEGQSWMGEEDFSKSCRPHNFVLGERGKGSQQLHKPHRSYVSCGEDGIFDMSPLACLVRCVHVCTMTTQVCNLCLCMRCLMCTCMRPGWYF